MDQDKKWLVFCEPMYKVLEQRPSISFSWTCNWKNCMQPKFYLFIYCMGGYFSKDFNMPKRGFALVYRCTFVNSAESR